VEFATRITLKKTGDDRKYPATVVTVSHDCDLALLNVEDKRFWRNRTASSAWASPLGATA